MILRPWTHSLTVAIFLFCIACGAFEANAEDQQSPLTMVVMDPLAAPLSCPCVEGYAQRDYTVLAKHIEKAIDRKVIVVFNESLPAAMKKTNGKADLVIGKQSVVRADAKLANQPMTGISQLTDLKGNTTQVRDDCCQQGGPSENRGKPY